MSVLHVYTGRMPRPALHYLSYFVRVSVTVGLSCEGLWRFIFTYANFLLPDSLHANMQTTYPVHTCRGSPTSAPSPPRLPSCGSSPAYPGCPVPSTHREEVGLGEF